MPGSKRGRTYLWKGMTPDERFLSRILKTESCWLWRGSLNTGGYGQIRVHGKSVCVHRYSYERNVGPIPEGLTLDHLCSVRNCVNPAHLEPVTKGENSRRGIIKKGLKTHCKHGHDLSIYRRISSGGHYRCVMCARLAARRRWHKQAA